MIRNITNSTREKEAAAKKVLVKPRNKLYNSASRRNIEEKQSFWKNFALIATTRKSPLDPVRRSVYIAQDKT